MQKNTYIIWRLHYSSIILTKITKFSNTVCEAAGEQHASALLLAVQSGTIITKGIWQHLPKLYRNHGLKMDPSEIAGHMQNGVYTIVGTIPKVDKNVSLSLL